MLYKVREFARKARKPLVSLAIFCFCIDKMTGSLMASLDSVVAINLDAIAQIESGNRPHIFNKKTGATGLFQITPIALKDFNMFVGSDLKMDEMWIEEKNAHVAIWILQERIPRLIKHYKLPNTTLIHIAIWNWGIKNTLEWFGDGADFKKLPKETREFYEKYQKITGRRLTGEKV